ncbi:MAG TPA: single-stranded DNA-binding protein [Candidatus Nanopelagicaceae bacterium]|nr:single-stranded DNA-binding protein [Candidatus Nanopelagicaceae bacterium]
MTISITVTGNVATDVRSIATATGRQVAVFRLAVPDRRWIKGKGWVDGEPSFISITTFSQVATNVALSVLKGQPIIVVGRLRMASWQKEGNSGQSLEIEASHVGHDLARGTTTFAKSTVSIDLDDEIQVITEGLLAEVGQADAGEGESLSA